MKYQKNYHPAKQFIWDAIFLGTFFVFWAWHRVEEAIREVISILRPKDPSVKAYADFMRKRR